MVLQETTARQACCTFSMGISFVTTLRERISIILADDIVTGEKLPEESSEQIFPITEVRRNTNQLSYDDQFVSADTAETICVPTENPTIIITVPTDQIQNKNAQCSALNLNYSKLNRNIPNDLGGLQRGANRERAGGIEMRGKNYLHIKIGQDVLSAEPIQRYPKTKKGIKSRNSMDLRVPKELRKTNLESYQKHQGSKRKYMYEYQELDSDQEGMKVENTISGMKISTASIQDSQFHGTSSPASTLNDSTAVRNEFGFQDCQESKILIPHRLHENCNKEESGSSILHNILNPDSANFVPSNSADLHSSFLPKLSKLKKRKLEYIMGDLQIFHVSKTTVKLRASAKEKIQLLKEMNERWRRKRVNVIQKSLSSPEEKFEEEQASNRLKSVIKKKDVLRPVHFISHIEDQDLQKCILPKTLANPSNSTENKQTICLEEMQVKSLNLSSPPKSLKRRKRIPLISVGGEMGCSKIISTCHYCNILHVSCKHEHDGSIAKDNQRFIRNECCWRNRDNVIRENSLKYPSLAKLLEIYKSNSLDYVDRVMGWSGKISHNNEIGSRSKSSDSSDHINLSSVNFAGSTFKMNEYSSYHHLLICPEEDQINCSRENIAVLSADESCEGNLLEDNRSFDHEIVHQNIPIRLGVNLFDSTAYGASNEQRNNDNLNSITHFQVVPPGTSSISSSCGNPGKTDMSINPEYLLNLKQDNQHSDYVENIDEYIDASESIESYVESSSVQFLNMNLGNDHTDSKSVFKETNKDIKMSEIRQKAQTKNFTLHTLSSNSLTTAAVNITQDFLKALQSVNLAVIKIITQFAHKFSNKE